MSGSTSAAANIDSTETCLYPWSVCTWVINIDLFSIIYNCTVSDHTCWKFNVRSLQNCFPLKLTLVLWISKNMSNFTKLTLLFLTSFKHLLQLVNIDSGHCRKCIRRVIVLTWKGDSIYFFFLPGCLSIFLCFIPFILPHMWTQHYLYVI